MKKEDVSTIRNLKREIRTASKRMMARDMIFDNIKDIIPSHLTADIEKYSSMNIDLKFKDETDDNKITADIFDKTVEKISRKLRTQPYVYAGKSNLDATWYLYLKEMPSVRLQLTTGNTEKCELIETTRVVTDFEPTGYCKILMEKKYFES